MRKERKLEFLIVIKLSRPVIRFFRSPCRFCWKCRNSWFFEKLINVEKKNARYKNSRKVVTRCLVHALKWVAGARKPKNFVQSSRNTTRFMLKEARGPNYQRFQMIDSDSSYCAKQLHIQSFEYFRRLSDIKHGTRWKLLIQWHVFCKSRGSAKTENHVFAFPCLHF